MIFPSLFGAVALLGLNSALAMSAARQRVNLWRQTRAALFLGSVSSLSVMIVGWIALPWLVPVDMLQLNRLNLIYVPLFVLTAHLMAIDQGSGNFRRFNIAETSSIQSTYSRLSHFGS